jgi:hypothetical protein
MTEHSGPAFSIDDIESISRYCETTYKPPVRPWLGVSDTQRPDQVNPGLTLFKMIRVALPSDAFRRVTLHGRYHYAAWNWIAPSMDFTLAKLETLKANSGLGPVNTKEFVNQLAFASQRASRRHPRLVNWIKLRTALLEFATFQNSGPSPEILSAIRAGVLGLSAQAYRQSRSLDDNPQRNLTRVLEAVVAEAQRLLSRSGNKCRASANLMLPITLDENIRNGTLPFVRNRGNAEKARMLWGKDAKHATRGLLVVAETELDEHVGFWVPILSTARGTLPGACRAFRGGHGVAIFKRHLPNLTALGFSAELNARWREYVLSHIEPGMEHGLFVSIPVRGADNSERVIAVVNINANPFSSDDWFRAFHRDWLEVVEQNISPLAAICASSLFITDAMQNAARALDDQRRPRHSLSDSREKILELPNYKQKQNDATRNEEGHPND